MVGTFTLVLVIVIIFIALIFDYTNGFHDSANSIATIVSTKVLSPKKAVLMAAACNFLAAFTFGVAVANTISKIININNIDKGLVPYIVLGGLIGAIAWNLITWYLGLPTSSSHALIGGLTGSGVVAGMIYTASIMGGLHAIKVDTIITVVIFMFVSPVIGFIAAFIFMAGALWVCRRSTQAKVDRWFKRLQLLSASAYSFAHGTNDAQKTIGIIIPLLFAIDYFGKNASPSDMYAPWWIIIAAYAAIALGTLSGGWRIVKTMGSKITKLRPIHGFASEMGGFVTTIGSSLCGIPVSTTHIKTASIMGVGATKRLSAVRWGVAREIVWAWILTIPLSALIGAAAFFVISLFL